MKTTRTKKARIDYTDGAFAKLDLAAEQIATLNSRLADQDSAVTAHESRFPGARASWQNGMMVAH